MKCKAGQSTAGGYILVLLTNRLAETVDFDFASQFRQLLWFDLAHPVHIKRLQESCGETPGRPKPCTCGDIRQRRDLHLRRLEAEHFDGFADDRMLNVI